MCSITTHQVPLQTQHPPLLPAQINRGVLQCTAMHLLVLESLIVGSHGKGYSVNR